MLSNESSQPITSYASLCRDCCDVMTDFDLVARAFTRKEMTLRVMKKKIQKEMIKRKKLRIFARKLK